MTAMHGQHYIDAIAPEHRPPRPAAPADPGRAPRGNGGPLLQDPTYKVGNRRLHVGAWKHGLSIYGWQQGRDDAFTSRHPELKTSRGPCSYGLKTQRQSAMTSSATSCAQLWTPDNAWDGHSTGPAMLESAATNSAVRYQTRLTGDRG
jgi:hypothetical protein